MAAVDLPGTGHVALSGRLLYPSDLGLGPLDPGPGDVGDILLVRFDGQGNAMWNVAFGDGAFQEGGPIVWVDGPDELPTAIYAASSYEGAVTVGGATLASAGSNDVLLVKLRP